MTFPAVTICNSNRISCSRFKIAYDHWEKAEVNDDNKETFEKLYKIACLNVCPNSIDVEQLSCPSPSTNTEEKRKKRSPGSGPPEGPAPPGPALGEIPPNMKAQYEFLQLYMSLNEKVRLSIGHQFEDFIKECTFLGSDCLNVRLSIIFYSDRSPRSQDVLHLFYSFKVILRTWPVQLTEPVILSIPTSLVMPHPCGVPLCLAQIWVSQSWWILSRFSICRIASPRVLEPGFFCNSFVQYWCLL